MYALAAAALFGASTPAAKLLAGEMPAFLLAGLLYAGSGIGLSLWIALRTRGGAPPVRLRSHARTCPGSPARCSPAASPARCC